MQHYNEIIFVVSKIGNAEGGNIHASFAAWRSSAMAIKSSALESARRVLQVWEEIGEVTQGYGACRLRKISYDMGRKRRSKGGAVCESIIG